MHLFGRYLLVLFLGGAMMGEMVASAAAATGSVKKKESSRLKGLAKGIHKRLTRGRASENAGQQNEAAESSSRPETFFAVMPEHLSHEQLNGAGIPKALVFLGEHIKGNLDTEGLFRLSPRLAMANEARAALDQASAHPESLEADALFHDPHIATALFKAYLRDLPGRLISQETFNEVKRVGITSEDVPTVLLRAHRGMGRVRQGILKYVLDIIEAVESHQETNKMARKNLLITLSPNMVDIEGSSPSLDIVGDLDLASQIVDKLIEENSGLGAA